MDLAVSIRVYSLPLLILLQVRNMHGNHGRLFFLDIEKLDKSILQSVVKVHGFVCLEMHRSDVLVANFQFAIFHDEEWSLHPACVSVEADLFVLDVSHN
jgi:hypothetical protein